MRKIVVIGAGLGGLSAAALLAKAGYDVTLVEKNREPGGRAAVWKRDGFIFDLGPSWYMLPELFDQYFAEFGRQSEDFYHLERLDPSYRIYWNTQEYVDVPADLDAARALFESIELGAGAKLDAFLADAAYKYQVGFDKFVYQDYSSIRQLLKPELIFSAWRLNLLGNLESHIKRYFKHPRLQQILSFPVVFLGGSPKNVPALYSLMAHADFNRGIWYPRGGIGKVVEAFVEIALEAGVRFHFGEPVEKILCTKGRVHGVQTSAGTLAADIVVSNADYAHTELTLLAAEDRSYPEAYWQKRTFAPSAFLIYLGLNRRLPMLQHHTFYFDPSWEKHFDSLFKIPAWPENPSFYINVPSRTDPTVAPEGGETLMLLVPIAAGLNDDNVLREAFGNMLLRRLNEIVGFDLAQHTVVKKQFGPHDFRSRYNAYGGTAFGLAHTLGQTACFRPRLRSQKLRNLFYVGQYTHPGIGIPIVPISAQLVRDQIVNDLSVS